MYQQYTIEPALQAEWARDVDALPLPLKVIRKYYPEFSAEAIQEIRHTFYALCTHIDHQLRVVLGPLRETAVPDNTIILVAANHGDMLGDFGLLAKRSYFQRSANVPMILMGSKAIGVLATIVWMIGWLVCKTSCQLFCI